MVDRAASPTLSPEAEAEAEEEEAWKSGHAEALRDPSGVRFPN